MKELKMMMDTLEALGYPVYDLTIDEAVALFRSIENLVCKELEK